MKYQTIVLVFYEDSQLGAMRLIDYFLIETSNL